MSSCFFITTFNSNAKLNFRPLAGIFPSIDSYAKDGSYTMGADSLALSLIYFTLMYHRLWVVALPLMVGHLLYYGPAIGGAPSAAIVSALMLIWESFSDAERWLFKLIQWLIKHLRELYVMVAHKMGGGVGNWALLAWIIPTITPKRPRALPKISMIRILTKVDGV